MAEKLTDEKKTVTVLDKGKIRIGKTAAAVGEDALVKEAMTTGFSGMTKAEQDALITLLLKRTG